MPRLLISCAKPHSVTTDLNAFCDALASESERVMNLSVGFNQWQVLVPVACSRNCHDIEIDIIFSAGAVTGIQDADGARQVAAKLEEFCRSTPLLMPGISYAVWPMGHRLAGYGEGGIATGGK